MDSKIELGTLAKVSARGVFPDGKAPLTIWLAEHLDLLGASLGMDLELVHQNGVVGSFSADIIARDTGRDRIVIVQNQIESSDDSHFGQLITYAGDRDARVVVWVSPDFRESHRQALEWLNRRSGSGAEFYAIGFDLYRIDDSKPGLELHIVAGPNGRSASAGPGVAVYKGDANPGASSVVAAANGSAVANGIGAAANPVANGSAGGAAYAAGDHQEAYRKFFQRLVDELREKHRFTNAKLGQPQNWYSFASGMSGVVYSIWFSTGGRVRAELYINVGNREVNRAIFERLRQHASEAEKEFGDKLEWDATESRRACSIGTHLTGKIDDPPEVQETLLKWAIERLLRLKTVFSPRLPGIARQIQQEGERVGRAV